MSSYTVPDEADNGRTHAHYALSMAKTNNPHTGGSQFFIVDPDAVGQDGSPGTPHLDGVHTVFGEVTSGFEHIDAITALCDTQNCQNDKTPQDVVLESVTTNMEDDSWWKFW
jgi:cyclophilin family peptidyl-prolyl cis-trans isomerase